MDQKTKRGIAVFVAGVAATVVATGLYMWTYQPAQRPAGDLKIDATPQRLARGRYLVEHVVGCLDCHTERDRTAFLLPATGEIGAGGECFGSESGIPGRVCVPNITSDPETGLGAWSDDEILRAVREGVGRDGRALFPMMPYTEYASLSDEDTYSVVAYIRSLPPVRQQPERTSIDFPVSFFIARTPAPITAAVSAPPPAATAEYGRYLATVAGCHSCHFEDLSGGQEFVTPAGVVRSSNLTPHPTGVTPPDLAGFSRMFRGYSEENREQLTIEENRFTLMPWVAYSGMSDDDLAAIFGYLRGIRPIENQVQTYGAAN